MAKKSATPKAKQTPEPSQSKKVSALVVSLNQLRSQCFANAKKEDEEMGDKFDAEVSKIVKYLRKRMECPITASTYTWAEFEVRTRVEDVEYFERNRTLKALCAKYNKRRKELRIRFPGIASSNYTLRRYTRNDINAAVMMLDPYNKKTVHELFALLKKQYNLND
jgi:hypothetical protein